MYQSFPQPTPEIAKRAIDSISFGMGFRARSGSRRSKTDRELDSLLEVVAIRGQGEFVGEMALISVRSVRSAFVRAQTKVTVRCGL